MSFVIFSGWLSATAMRSFTTGDALTEAGGKMVTELLHKCCRSNLDVKQLTNILDGGASVMKKRREAEAVVFSDPCLTTMKSTICQQKKGLCVTQKSLFTMLRN